MKACKNCRYIVYSTNEKKCPKCGGDVTEKFSGLLIIIDAERSEIAKIAEINANGAYAMRVKQ